MTTSNPSFPRRKRGAPPGNLNAFKHGLYSHYFSRTEINHPQFDLQAGITDEETFMRLIMTRTIESMEGRELTHDEYIVALRTIALAVGRIDSLLRFRLLVHEDQTRLDKLLKPKKPTPPEENNGN